MATWLVVAVSCSSLNGAAAQLELVAGKQLQTVFGGNTQKISLRWRNPGGTMLEADLQMRLTQLTSATAAPMSEAPWKKLQVLPGQTIVESATIPFPAVRAETHFLVQWFQNTNQVLGSTEVLIYPTNLLAELQPLVGHEDGALGVFDPQDELKPLLKNAKVDFIDLGNVELEKYRGKLAIIGPFDSRTQMDATLAAEIKTIAQKGVGVVWIQPPSDDSSTPRQKPMPGFYCLPENQVAAVIVQPELVANLAVDPQSQLNLVHFCKLALNPVPPVWPGVLPQ